MAEFAIALLFTMTLSEGTVEQISEREKYYLFFCHFYFDNF
jgi:hypothetical protein